MGQLFLGAVLAEQLSGYSVTLRNCSVQGCSSPLLGLGVDLCSFGNEHHSQLFLIIFSCSGQCGTTLFVLFGYSFDSFAPVAGRKFSISQNPLPPPS